LREVERERARERSKEFWEKKSLERKKRVEIQVEGEKNHKKGG